MKLTLQKFLLNVGTPSAQSSLSIEKIIEKWFGPVVALQVEGGRAGLMQFLDRLHWEESEKPFLLKVKKSLQDRFISLKDAKIENPSLLSLLVPKVIQQSLIFPCFMKDMGLSFQRGKSFLQDPKYTSQILYRNTIILSQYLHTNAKPNNPATFLQDLAKAYLHSPMSNELNPKLYPLSSKDWWHQDYVFLLYLPTAQTIVAVSMPTVSFNYLWQNDPFGIFLCLLGSMFSFLVFFPKRFFKSIFVSK